MDLNGEPYPKRRVDPVPGLMLLVTLAALGGAGWLRLGNLPTAQVAQTAAVGAEAPLLRLIDPATSEPVVMVGLHDRVAWVVFWSAGATSGRACLRDLESATRKLRLHQRFAIVAAAVEVEQGALVRSEARDAGFPRPVYLAGPETCRRFHAGSADPPVHILIDDRGQVLAMARGADDGTIARLAEIVQRRLDELEPAGQTRFACQAPADPSHLAALPKSRPTIPPRIAMTADQALSLSDGGDSARRRT